MSSIRRILILIFAVMTFLVNTECRHVQPARQMKLNICEECNELLVETITEALEDLRGFSKCLEKYSGPILDGTENTVLESRDEMFSKLPTLIHQFKMIECAWSKYKLPLCPQNLEKHLKRTLCLMRGTSKKQQSCKSREHVTGPKRGAGKTIDFTGNYIRMVYGTLNGFVSSLQ